MKSAPVQSTYTEQQMRAMRDGSTMIFDAVTAGAIECRCHVCVLANAITVLASNYTEHGKVTNSELKGVLTSAVMQTLGNAASLPESAHRAYLIEIGSALINRGMS